MSKVDPNQILDQALNNLPEMVRSKVDRNAAIEEIEATCETVKVADKPRLYQMETTSRCNLACGFCPRTTDLLNSGARDLDAEMPVSHFESILDQMPWLESLELFHFGEPFMHKDFSPYVEACKKRNIYTVVASNLLPATPEKVDAVFEAGLDFLVMDIDSLDSERYASMRVNGNLQTLHKRVQYILSHPKRPYCVAQTIMKMP